LLAQVDVRCDVRAAEDLFGVQRIVRATPDPQVRRLVGATQRSRLDVVEFEHRPRWAARACGVRERALLAVALEDGAPNRARNAA
jgi:hypothetical protein